MFVELVIRELDVINAIVAILKMEKYVQYVIVIRVLQMKYVIKKMEHAFVLLILLVKHVMNVHLDFIIFQIVYHANVIQMAH